MYYWNRWVRRVAIDAPPVFIVGCGHSGTTLLLAIIGTHSRIYGVPYESSIAVNHRPEPFLKAFGTFDRWTIAAGMHRWVEKTPRHINQLEKILKWSPDAKVLLIIRDGRDVACSLPKQKGSLEDGIRRWVDENRGSQVYWDHPNVHICRYEDLVADLESTVRTLVGFLDEEYEPALCHHYRTRRRYLLGTIGKFTSAKERRHAQRRNRQVNQPVFDGRGGWKEMSEDELALVNDIGGDLLTELGYIG
jgi:hypothetical protein